MKILLVLPTAGIVAGLANPALAPQKEVETANDVMIRSGGVEIEERVALDAARDRYNLRLAFADSDGAYVADVTVRLMGQGGRTVYEGNAEGPYLFARLDPGRYRLEAKHEGVTQIRMLNVGAKQTTPIVYLHWPAGA
jgi:hypothetical protein